MKIFASDYDGTLRVGPNVSERNIEMINKWRNAGNLFVLVTGRSIESATSEMQRNGFTCDYLIGNNGGVIYQDGNCLKESLMDFDRALDVLEAIKQTNCISYVINDGYHRAKVIMDPNKPDLKYGMMKATLTVDEVLRNRKIAQFVLSLDDMQMAKETAKGLNDQFHDVITAYVNVDCIDVVPCNISKADGVHYLQDKYDLSNSDIHVIGDSYNDLPMIESYQGYTLNSAEMVIQDQASRRFEDVAEAISWVLESNEK